MKPFEIAAILGALAWIPFVWTSLKNWWSKPEVRVITSRNVEIGFTTLGSIFNLHLAFSTKNKDLVITEIRIILEHNSGEKKFFGWQGIQQEVMQIKTPDGTSLPYQKENSVFAIKLNEKDIEERFIRFQESSFHTEKLRKENNIAGDLIPLKNQGKFNVNEFMKSAGMQSLFQYIKQSFSWKAGTYNVTIEIDSPSEFNIKDNKYSFSLTPIDIEELEKNKGYIEQCYKNEIKTQDEGEQETVTWNWRYPVLSKPTSG